MTSDELRKAWAAATVPEKNAMVAEHVMWWPWSDQARERPYIRRFPDGAVNVYSSQDCYWAPVLYIDHAWEVQAVAYRPETRGMYIRHLYEIALNRKWDNRAARIDLAPFVAATPEQRCLAALLTTAEDG